MESYSTPASSYSSVNVAGANGSIASPMDLATNVTMTNATNQPSSFLPPISAISMSGSRHHVGDVHLLQPSTPLSDMPPPSVDSNCGLLISVSGQSTSGAQASLLIAASPRTSTNNAETQKVRRSNREIKRPKFDDEIIGIDGSLPPKASPRKRTNTMLSPEPQDDSQPVRKRAHRSTDAEPNPHQHQALGAVNVPAKGQKANPPNAVEAAPVSDRKRKERIASKNQAMRESATAVNAHVAEVMKTWSVEDDIALVSAVTHICDLKAVFNLMKFTKRFTLADIEEHWYELMYDENLSRPAKKRMDGHNKEKIRAIQSRIPFSTEEEDIIRTVPSGTEGEKVTAAIANLLEQHKEMFHHARNVKVIEEHWRELKYWGLLSDQKQVPHDDDLAQMEKNFDLCSMVESDPTSVEERNLTRNVVAAERDGLEWDSVGVEYITGVQTTNQISADSRAILKGRCVTYDLRREKVLIGRNTKRHKVDVNLTIEGPAAKISRKQAMLKFRENNECVIYNLAKRPIFVDSNTVLQGEKATLKNNSVIEIGVLYLTFYRNDNYGKPRDLN